MAINTATIQHRRGSLEDFNPDKMVPGELAFTTDGSRKVFAAFAPGDYKELISSEEIQEDLNEVKEEVQVKLDEALEEVDEKISNSSDKANVIEVGKSGETIIATDSSDNKLRGLNVYGKSKQESTTGKNLWKEFTTPQTLNGVTLSKVDDYYVLNGKCTFSSLFVTTTELESGTYTISANNPKHNNIDYALIQIYSAETGKDILAKDNAVNTKDTKTITSGTYELRIRIEYNVTYDNFIIKPQLEKGSVATEYEAYTGGKASPSPQYPQTIENCENTEVSVYGGNLFGGNSEETPQYDGHNYCDLGGKYGFNADYNAFVIPIIENKSYYFWGNFADTSLMIFHYLNSDREVISTYTSLYGKKEGIIPALANAKFIRFSLKTTDKMNIMLNMGTEALPYETYKEKQSLTIPYTLCGIPVSSGGNYTDDKGQEWVCDEINFERGVYVKRIERISITSDRHSRSDLYDSYNLFSFDTGVLYDIDNYVSRTIPAMSNKFINTNNTINSFNASTIADSGWKGCMRIIFKMDKSIASLNDFMNYVGDDCFVQVPLKTPIETPLTAEQIEAFKALHSNYPNTTVMNDNGAGMMVKYGADTKLYIDNKFAELAAQLV